MQSAITRASLRAVISSAISESSSTSLGAAARLNRAFSIVVPNGRKPRSFQLRPDLLDRAAELAAQILDDPDSVQLEAQLRRIASGERVLSSLYRWVAASGGVDPKLDAPDLDRALDSVEEFAVAVKRACAFAAAASSFYTTIELLRNAVTNEHAGATDEQKRIATEALASVGLEPVRSMGKRAGR